MRVLPFQVFKNLQLFMENKEPDDDLFDRLNVSKTSLVEGNYEVLL